MAEGLAGHVGRGADRRRMVLADDDRGPIAGGERPVSRRQGDLVAELDVLETADQGGGRPIHPRLGIFREGELGVDPGRQGVEILQESTSIGQLDQEAGARDAGQALGEPAQLVRRDDDPGRHVGEDQSRPDFGQDVFSEPSPRRRAERLGSLGEDVGSFGVGQLQEAGQLVEDLGEIERDDGEIAHPVGQGGERPGPERGLVEHRQDPSAGEGARIRETLTRASPR